MRRIVLCSGKVNRYGYRIVPSGVVLDAYLKNPVILTLHDTKILSIGKMTDIRIDQDGEYKGQLTALPEFDMDDPIAVDVARKYEKGYLNSCSMGHDPIESSDDPSLALPGQKLATVTKTELLEVSMTNIPGDRDAIGMTLDSENGGDLTRLSKIKEQSELNNNKIEKMEELAKELGLAQGASDAEILNAVITLKLSAESAKEAQIEALMTLGKTKGVVTDENLPSYKKLAFADYDSTATLINNVEVKAATPEVNPNQTLSIAEQLKAASGGNTLGVEQITHFKLSKENPTELMRIKKEEPELYEKLCADYASGIK